MLTIPDIVTVDLEDSFQVFLNPRSREWEVKAINPDGSIAAVIDSFEFESTAKRVRDNLVEHTARWVGF